MARPRRSARLLLGLLLAVPGGGIPAARIASPPKLIVLIAVDQMRYDYLDRFSPFFGEKGFRRLVREGRRFTRARYAHAATFTGPAHAVIGSGVYADRSGIIGNRWYSRDAGKDVICIRGRVRAEDAGRCAEDGAPAGPASGIAEIPSPCNFGAKSLAERLKGRYRAARVVGVSLKDTAAILMTGRGADAAYWFEEGDGSGTFECSKYYPDCRDQALRFNREEGLTKISATGGLAEFLEKHPEWREWKCSLPRPCEKACSGDVPRAHQDAYGLGREFPHPVKDLAALIRTPFGNDLLETYVERVVEVHDLGRNPTGQPDLLAVSFSSPDHLGHLYGPDSCEVADGMRRLDETLGKFLDALVRRVGRENLLVFLTADHGVAPLPEVSLRRGIPAGRVDLASRADRKTGTVADLPELRQRIEFEIARRLGAHVDGATPLRNAFVPAFHEPNLYLNGDRIGRQTLPLCRSWLKEYLLRVEGIREAYTWDEIRAGEAPEAVRLAFREDRSGDLVVLLNPYWILKSGSAAADHGQVYEYDSRVPLLAWGRGVEAGVVADPVDVAQIAPTLAGMLGLDSSGFSRPAPLPLAELR